MSIEKEVIRYYSERAREYDVSAGYEDTSAEELREPLKILFQNAFIGHDVLEIACGTGYWTKVIAVTAKSVLATDISSEMINIAREKLVSVTNIKFQTADAFSLENISGRFTAAFAHWWWSHMPKSRIQDFLTALHSKLIPGAFVLFSDQLQYSHKNRRYEKNGNLLEKRILSSGHKFEVIKNFPTREEVLASLEGMAKQIIYKQYPKQRMWTVSYHT